MGPASYRRRVAGLIAVALLVAGCAAPTSVVIDLAAANGPAPEGMTLTITVDTPPRMNQRPIASLPEQWLVLLPDGTERLTATLTGTRAGVPFTKHGEIETVPHQQRHLALTLDGSSVPDLGIAPGGDLADGPPPVLALANALLLGPQANQVDATVKLDAHQLVVVAAYWNWNAATIAVSDSAGHDWKMAPLYSNPVTTCANNNGSQAQIFYAENTKPGMTTITVTESPGNNGFGAFLLAYSGVALSNALETESGATAGMASNAMVLPSLTTTRDGDLLLALFNDSKGGGTMVAGDGFRADVIDTVSYSLIEDAVGVPAGMHAVGATLPNGKSDGCWVGAAAAFKRR